MKKTYISNELVASIEHNCHRENLYNHVFVTREQVEVTI